MRSLPRIFLRSFENVGPGVMWSLKCFYAHHNLYIPSLLCCVCFCIWKQWIQLMMLMKYVLIFLQHFWLGTFGLQACRGVNLVWNLGGRWQTAFGSILLTRKTGRVETSDTVEDKNKNVYIITGQMKLKHICTIFGDMTYYRPPVRRFGGTCPLSPTGFTPLRAWIHT